MCRAIIVSDGGDVQLRQRHGPLGPLYTSCHRYGHPQTRQGAMVFPPDRPAPSTPLVLSPASERSTPIVVGQLSTRPRVVSAWRLAFVAGFSCRPSRFEIPFCLSLSIRLVIFETFRKESVSYVPLCGASFPIPLCFDTTHIFYFPVPTYFTPTSSELFFFFGKHGRYRNNETHRGT